MTEPSTSGNAASPKKRGNWLESKKIGRTTIYKVPESESWQINYSVDGEQFRKSLFTSKKKDAERRACEIEAALARGGTPEPTRGIKISDAAAKYLEDRRRRNLTESSLREYARHLTEFKTFAIKERVVRLDRITPALLNKYHDLLRDQGLGGIMPPGKRGRRRGPVGPRSLRSKLKTIRQMVHWAHRQSLLTHDPLAAYELPAKVTSQAYCWTSEEVRRILANADPEYVDVFNLLRMTGMRAGEVCWLTKEDLDRERHELQIRAKKLEGLNLSWKPKHGVERVIPLSQEAFGIACRLADASPGPWLVWADNGSKRRPGQCSQGRLAKAVARACKRAGVARGSTHTFRHVFCSTMANARPPVPPLQLMKLMGHGSIEIVMVYYHSTREELRACVDSVDFSLQFKGPAAA
jgi:integrase